MFNLNLLQIEKEMSTEINDGDFYIFSLYKPH